MNIPIVSIIIFTMVTLCVITPLCVLAIKPKKRPETNEGFVGETQDEETIVNVSKSLKRVNVSKRDRLYVEHLLFIEWFVFKNDDGIYPFPMITIHSGERMLYVDAIMYDTSERSNESLDIMSLHASDDKLLIRVRHDSESTFLPVMYFQIVELQELQGKIEDSHFCHVNPETV